MDKKKKESIERILGEFSESITKLRSIFAEKEEAQEPYCNQEVTNIISAVRTDLTELRKLIGATPGLRVGKIYYEAESNPSDSRDKEKIGIFATIDHDNPEVAIEQAKAFVHGQLSSWESYFRDCVKIQDGKQALEAMAEAVETAKEKYDQQVKFFQGHGIPIDPIALPVFTETKPLITGEVMNVVEADAEF